MTTPIEDAIAFTEKILAKFKEFEVPEDVAAYAKHRTILDALRFKQKAEKQEPVAWLKEWGGKGSAAAGIQVDLHPDNDAWMQRLSPTVIPLYTHPLPPPIAPDRVSVPRDEKTYHAELKELHRMQLASIAAISLCNTRTSAEKHRNILPEYRTPEFELVCDAVDREMGHREKVAELEADKAKLTVLVDELLHQIAKLEAAILQLLSLHDDPCPHDAATTRAMARKLIATQEQGK